MNKKPRKLKEHKKPNYRYKDISHLEHQPKLVNGRVWYADGIDRKKYITGKPVLNAAAVAKIIAHYLGQTREGISESLRNKDTPMLDITICSILTRAAKDGDQSKLEFLLNRVIGKVADRIETINFDERALQKLDAVPTSQLLDAIVQAQVIDDETEDKEPEYLGANNNK